MLDIDISRAKSFLSDREYDEAYSRAETCFERVRSEKGKGAEMLGWRRILAEHDDDPAAEIEKMASAVREDADVFIVCGIGGSYLGARAVIDALGSFFNLDDAPEILYAGHHMSGKYLNELIRYLEEPGEGGEPKSVYLNVISKSGSTLETALAFRVLSAWMHERYENPEERIICTTSSRGGVLNPQVEEFGYRKFIIPDDVGGRFSVLTPVGLIPIAVAGIDINTLVGSAVTAYHELERNPDRALTYAALRYALYKEGKIIEVITSFEPELHSIGRWMQQLMAESEAKGGEGIFPTVSTYSTDLHSLGQLIQQGRRNLLETFLVVENADSGVTIEATEKNVDNLNYLAGMNFREINGRALEGTMEAHVRGGVPSIRIILDRLGAGDLGEFIYFSELVTAIYCYCLDVNPFDQPGVEDYKQEMYKLLGK